MKNALHSVILLFLLCANSHAQQFLFRKEIVSDSTGWRSYMTRLSENLLHTGNPPDSNDMFRVQLTAEKYSEAISTIQSIRRTPLLFVQYELYAQAAATSSFNKSFSISFTDLFKRLNDKDALYINTAFLSRFGIEDLYSRWQQALQALKDRDSI